MDHFEEYSEMLSNSDKEFIIKQQEKPMDEETKNWTSLDLYYKGFHIKKSWGENISRVTLMAEIDGLIQAGFKPSWNEDTNKATVAPSTAQTTVSGQSVSTNSPLPVDDGLRVPCKYCNGPTEYKEFTSKKGNYVKGYFCINKQLKCQPHYVK